MSVQLLLTVGPQDDTLPNGMPYMIYAVFDGHGGSAASTFVSESLNEIITKQLLHREQVIEAAVSKLESDPEANVALMKTCLSEVMTESFAAVNTQLEKHRWLALSPLTHSLTARSRPMIPGGTTACVVLIIGGFLVIASTGDSQAMHLHNDDRVYLSSVHRPGDPAERRRLQKVVWDEPGLLDPKINHGLSSGMRFCRASVRLECNGRVISAPKPEHKGLPCKIWDHHSDDAPQG